MAYSLSIQSQPTADFVPAYRPVTFDVRASCSVNTEDVISIRADIYRDGAYLVSQRANFPPFTISGGTKNYQVIFDIQQSIQDSFDTTFLATLHGNFHVIFTAEKYNDGSKYLEDTAATATSSTLFAVNATLQHDQVQNLNAFYGDGFRLATNCPNQINAVTPDKKNRFLPTTRTGKLYTAFLFQNSTAVSFTITAKFYDSDFGYLGDTDVVSSTTHNGKDFVSADISISALDSSNEYPGAKYYTVQISYGGKTSKLYGFKIEHCKPPLTVHFLNQYGGYDNYSFQHTEEDFVTKSAGFERPLPATFNRRSRGMVSMQMQDNSEITGSNDKLMPDWLRWLRELQSSSDVYYEKEINGAVDFIPATIKDSTNQIYDSEAGIGLFAVTVIPANAGIRQRN